MKSLLNKLRSLISSDRDHHGKHRSYHSSDDAHKQRGDSDRRHDQHGHGYYKNKKRSSSS